MNEGIQSAYAVCSMKVGLVCFVSVCVSLPRIIATKKTHQHKPSESHYPDADEFWKREKQKLPKCNYVTECRFPCQSPVDHHDSTVYDLPPKEMCNNKAVCKFRIDEKQCVRINGSLTPSSKGHLFHKAFRCLDRRLVIPDWQLCDGIVHCNDGSDESMCLPKVTGQICQDIFPYNLEDDYCKQLFCAQKLKPLRKKITSKIPALKSINCDEYKTNKSDTYKCKAAEKYINETGMEACNVSELDHFSFRFAFPNDTIVTCPFGDDEVKWIFKDQNCVNFSKGEECDFAECGCSEDRCDDSIWFECGDNETVHEDSVCDGRRDCYTGRDECECSTSFLESHDGISHILLRILFWFLATVANSIQIVHKTIILVRNKPKLPNTVKINYVHVWSLALSDVLVGVFVVILALKMSHRDICTEMLKWQGSWQCSFIGIMGFIGCQMSVNVLTLITLQRLYSILRPFSKSSFSFAVFRLTVAWVFTITLAVLPICFTGAFHREITLKKNILFTDVVELEHVKELMVSTRQYSTLPSQTMKTEWQWFEETLDVLGIDVEYTMGFYSSNALCLPVFVDIKEDEEINILPFTMITYNFICFIVIAISYIIIYRDTMNGRQNDMERVKLQRKMMWIVGTDFLCWMPICIMTFYLANEDGISETDFWSATICILPINSVLNPFIYSNLPEICMSYWRRVFKQATSGDSKRTEQTEDHESEPGIKIN